MADYVITAAQVTAGVSATTKTGTAGATIAAGEALYEDPADSKLKLADANGATADIRKGIGLALHASADGQPLKYATEGELTLSTGAAIGAVGATVILSATPGKLAPVTDNVAGWWVNVLGFLSADGKKITLSIIRSPAATP